MALVNLQLPGTPRTTLMGPPEVQLGELYRGITTPQGTPSVS